jgi:pimeloyl-ACP methyl ester carboxylesterase
MARLLLGAAALTAFAYVALCALLFVLQRSMIYYPQPRGPAVPGTTALTLDAGDGARVEVTVRPSPSSGPGAPAVLYFGGNAEAVAYSLPELAAAFPDHALYLMHYRGYGGSSGRPSEAALVADALALHERVRAAHGARAGVVVVGRSLGSGVAVQLAAARPREVARLVLVTPYDSLAALAARFYPIFPVRWLLLDRYDSAQHAPQVDAPTLVVAAEHDDVIPRAHAEALAARFRAGVATLHVVAGAGHNDISESPEYARLLQGLR